MEFSLSPRQLELQARTRSFIADVIIPLERDPRATAHGPTEELRNELVAHARAAGLLTPHASVELGGLGLTHAEKAFLSIISQSILVIILYYRNSTDFRTYLSSCAISNTQAMLHPIAFIACPVG